MRLGAILAVITVVSAAVSVPACSASVQLGGDGNGADASSPDAESQSDAPVDGRAPGCPATPPTAGSPCTPSVPPFGSPWPCEYGSDPHCTTIAQCEIPARGSPAVWTIQPPRPACHPNPSGCPTAFEPDAGATGPVACPTQDSCTYPEGRCACVPCQIGGGICGSQNLCGQDGGDGSDAGSTWDCEPWPKPDRCPEPRPLLGTPCNVDPNLTCAYGPLCCGLVGNTEPVMECIGGYWDYCDCGC